MSDSSSDEQGGHEDMFSCRKCPGKTFTAAEKDTHRMWHLAQNAKGKMPKGGSRKRRGVSPAPTDMTDVTLFNPVEITPPPSKADKKKPDSPAKRGRPKSPAKKPKIQSKKKYDRGVKPTRSNSG